MQRRKTWGDQPRKSQQLLGARKARYLGHLDNLERSEFDRMAITNEDNQFAGINLKKSSAPFSELEGIILFVPTSI